MSEDDRTTIGLTPANRNVIDRVESDFNEKADAAKFAMALAIQQGVEPGQTPNTETVWNVGSFDPEGELRNLVIALHPEVSSPYSTVEHFVNQGLRLIESHLEESKELDIVEFV
jgi:hypothetical protein